MRDYPLDIRSCGGGECDALMSKGHHDDNVFLAAALSEWGEPLEGFDAPCRTWWRVVPDSTGEYAAIYHEAKPGARGAFPVTVIAQH